MEIKLKTHLYAFAPIIAGIPGVLPIAAGCPSLHASERDMPHFMGEYCMECHGHETQKRDLRLDVLAADFSDKACF
ncbi:MAG: hypothetical protein O3B25_03055 [Verrucomicrobia bacterium]|nr:hypothetical protein [Verrucomicrobiota bacterium]